MKFESLRNLFPIVNKFLYFNAASLSPYCYPVIDSMRKFELERAIYGSLCFDKWSQEVEDCRKLAAKICRAKESEIAFVKNTSEGVNLVALIIDWEKGDNVVVSDLDFPANIYPFLNLRRKGVEIKYVRNVGGKLLPEELEREIDDNTKLVSISSVMYGNGFRVDLNEIGKICVEKGVLLHVDATQSLGVFEMDVKSYNIDFLSAGGYKWLLSPLGSGIFYIKEELIDDPPILGWLSVKDYKAMNIYRYELKDSASRFEIGNMDISAIIGMKSALELIFSIGLKKIQKRVLDLATSLLEGLEKFELLSSFERKNRSGIISIKNNLNEKYLLNKGVIASFREYIRFSPHIYNSEEDISKLLDILNSIG